MTAVTGVSDINLTSGIGHASTTLSAFDAALYDAGIANYNILRLSSVIPPGAKLLATDSSTYSPGGMWGDRLYVVMADFRTSTPNEEAWAGIGWAIDDETGRGLFVEFEGTSEEYVRESIDHSLRDLMKTRRVDFGEINSLVRGVTCHEASTCALVAAVYKTEPW